MAKFIKSGKVGMYKICKNKGSICKIEYRRKSTSGEKEHVSSVKSCIPSDTGFNYKDDKLSNAN